MDTGRIQLTKNFYLDEFTRSEIAARQGREIKIAVDSPEFLAVKRMCETVLQPIRDALGSVHITSGIRPEWLNTLIGGATTSQHITGHAVDFVVSGSTPLEVCFWIKANDLPYDQLIHEFGRWTHVSIVEAEIGRRSQELTAKSESGRTVYLKGLEAVT